MAAFANGRYPLAWCRRHGDGRVFYTALGHKKEHYRDAAFRTHLLQGLLWAMGRE
jgi:type 1 glutamine amidotransferase